MMRGTGGNRFIPADATRADLMRSINDQLGDLHEWAAEGGQVFDLGEVSISTRRIPSGLISVSVEADLGPITSPAPTPQAEPPVDEHCDNCGHELGGGRRCRSVGLCRCGFNHERRS